ncbi:hypothetical protein [Aquihabitans sp. McL0605]|uniref:hypothetical protein n=1 Tax=Aquihabitans sp. McL0605 TaxID=3415671 RepID=UPI003CEA9AA7
MLTIVLVGADGAGKSTVTDRLLAEVDVPARRMYLGANPEARTHPLPTTRAVRWARSRSGGPGRAGGPPSLDRDAPAQGGVRSATRAAARVGNQMAEEAYQQAVIGWHHARGRLVVCDRHPLADQFDHDLAARPGLRRSRRVHGAFLRRAMAPPDLVIVLDAEPEVLFARKGEGTLSELAARRDEYLRYARSVPRSVVVDAAQPLDDVAADVLAAVHGALGSERRDHVGAVR